MDESPFLRELAPFFGTDPDHLYPAGIPLDMRTAAAKEGWEQDTEDDDYNAEIEKRSGRKNFTPRVNESLPTLSSLSPKYA